MGKKYRNNKQNCRMKKQGIKKPLANNPQKVKRPLVGRTLKTQDKFLPSNAKKVEQLKEKRWVGIICANDKNELAVIRLTDENTPNTTKLIGYKKGNKKDTYFKHFVEIVDNDGNPIFVDGVKFIENGKEYDLSDFNLNQINNKVLGKCKQAKSNREKINKLKNKKK